MSNRIIVSTEDERQNKNGMLSKRTKKILTYSFEAIIGVLWIISIIYGLIYDTNETLKDLGGFIGFCAVLGTFIYLHIRLLKKNRIDWDKYEDFKFISAIIAFISLTGFIGVIFQGEYLVGKPFILSNCLMWLTLGLYSFWVYLAVILNKPDALLLLRAFSIMIICFLGGCLGAILIHSPKVIEIANITVATLPYIGIFACGILFLTFFIKILIYSFSSDCKSAFSNQRVSYFTILLTVIAVILIIWFSHINEIAFTSRIENITPLKLL